VIPIQH